ncbi:MAG TPA: hypothetical protein PLY78_05150, partial [Methanospirillum sp.]|nr:hypothetical protein [Methanospirillum sp.]
LSPYAPKTVVKGNPLVVTGTTSFPEDSYFDLVLFYSKYTAGEVARTRVIVDRTQAFRVDFDTRHLERGQYKVEVHTIVSDNELFVERQLGSSSVIRRIVQITDRSDEITITSPKSQPLSQALTVSGRMRGIGDGVLTMRVFGPDDFTYGPLQIITKKAFADISGEFSTTVPVSSPGEYQVSMSDKNGYIGEYPFTVTKEIREEETGITTLPTTEIPVKPDTPPQTIPETPVLPSPTKTQTPFGLLAGMIGIACSILIFGKKK